MVMVKLGGAGNDAGGGGGAGSAGDARNASVSLRDVGDADAAAAGCGSTMPVTTGFQLTAQTGG